MMPMGSSVRSVALGMGSSVMHSRSAFIRRFIAVGLVAAMTTAAGAGPAAESPPVVAASAGAETLLLDPESVLAGDSGASGARPAEIALEDVAETGRGPDVEQVIPRELSGGLTGPDDIQFDESPFEEMPTESSSGGWFGNGSYYASAEMLVMSRGRNYKRVLGYDSTVLELNAAQKYAFLQNKQGLLTTDALPYNVSPGARITVGEYLGRDYLDRDRSIEFTYYGGFSFYQQDSWNAIINTNTQTYLVTPLSDSIAGFTGAQQFLTTSGGIFNSIEANYKLHRRLGRDKMVMVPDGAWTRHAERGWLPSLIVGTRLANYNEQFSFSGRAYDQPLSKFGGDYLIQTQNWLWGLNLGGELLSQNEFFYWGLRGRVAPAVAFDGTQQQFRGVNNGYQQPTAVPTQGTPLPPNGAPRGPFPEGTEVWKMAGQQIGPGFLGDLTLMAGWNITPNSSLQVGYDFLWVAGVATATRQFNLNKLKQNQIDPGGQVFLQGVSFGYNASW